jgi:hypothetical protein
MRSHKLFLLVGAGGCLGRIVLFRHGAASDLGFPLVSAYSGVSGCAATSRRRCFSARCNCMAARRNEPMELSEACDHDAAASDRFLVCYCGCHFRVWCFVDAELSATRVALVGDGRFSCLLGGVRISQCHRPRLTARGAISLTRKWIASR